MKKLLRVLFAFVVLLIVGLTIFWYSRPWDVDFEAVRSQVPHAEFSHFTDLDGVRVHYQECGTGAAVVLVHGFMASTSDWKDVLPLVSNRFHVISLDSARKFNALIRGSRLVVLEQCGHVPQVEMPARFAKEFTEFLTALR